MNSFIHNTKKQLDSFIPWVGGKRALREIIISRFPDEYKVYVEVFTGGAWVFFALQHKGVEEFINDANTDLVNLYHCVQTKRELFKWTLRYSLNARDKFNFIKSYLKQGAATLGDVKRAAYFYELIRYSFANNCKSYGGKTVIMRDKMALVDNCHKRLQGVKIENKDFEAIITEKDNENTFFYCDPPYYETESYYEAPFSPLDHQRLHDTLMNTNGKWMLSYNDCPEIRELYSDSSLYHYAFDRPNNIGNVTNKGSIFEEILIANYDMEEYRKKRIPQNEQLSLFGED